MSEDLHKKLTKEGYKEAMIVTIGGGGMSNAMNRVLGPDVDRFAIVPEELLSGRRNETSKTIYVVYIRPKE